MGNRKNGSSENTILEQEDTSLFEQSIGYSERTVQELQQQGNLLTFNKKGVTKYLWDTLCTLQGNPLFNDYYLVGGTALSLHIGHRVSDDIDLFTSSKIQKETIFDFVRQSIDKDVHIINNEGTIFQLWIERQKLKIDFVSLPYELLDPLIEKEGIRLVGKNDLSAMKISATGTRGNEAKDFVDLYYLLKEIPIAAMFDNFKKKYETDDVLHYVRSAMYFDDVTPQSWNSLKLIQEKIPSEVIKNTLTNEIVMYERKVLLDNSRKTVRQEEIPLEGKNERKNSPRHGHHR